MNMIHGYMTDKENRRTGILIGVKTDNGVIISGAKANTKVDKFNREAGLFIASKRVELALNGERPVQLPACMWADVQHFADRCRRYFETNELIMPEIKSFIAS
jgi:20S proteasome alpha/beta subunit